MLFGQVNEACRAAPKPNFTRMVELGYTPVLGTGAERRVGSSPTSGMAPENSARVSKARERFIRD